MSEAQAPRYEFDSRPDAGYTMPVADGVHWLRMPLPFTLGHINLWLLEDGNGWTIVDTGVAVDETEEVWARTFQDPMQGRPVNRIIATHLHPDHSGMIGNLSRKTGAGLWMTRAEYLLCRILVADTGQPAPDEGVRFYEAAGFSEGAIKAYVNMFGMFGKFVSPLPQSYKRLRHDELISVGDRDWRVIVGRGHSPEHACLYCAALKVIISGDQILPIITSNVSVHPTEPNANPLKFWMESHDKFLSTPADTFVLPAHNLPFYGVRERLRGLISHHDDRMLAIEEACVVPKTAKDLLPVLFARELDPRQMMMALGEAIAHLHLLMHRNRIQRDIADDGVYRFTSIDPDLERRAHPDAHDAPSDGPVMV